MALGNCGRCDCWRGNKIRQREEKVKEFCMVFYMIWASVTCMLFGAFCSIGFLWVAKRGFEFLFES